MKIIYVMGMRFVEGAVPDFGTIRLISHENKSKKDYILKSADIDKLNLITNAGQGSTAYCTDTKKMCIKHLEEWVEL